MGVFAIPLLIGATALQTIGSIQQGEAAADLANAQAQQQNLQAAQERDAAVAQAEKIRRAGRATAAQADAAFAASGVSVGEGTPVRINEQITRDAEEDAYNTILTGTRRGASLDTEAGFTRRAGRNSRTAGYFGAAGSLLQGASSYAQWRGRAPAQGGQIQ